MIETTEPVEVHPTLASALAAVQVEMPPLAKATRADVRNKSGELVYSYQYADLADVTPVILPLLGRHGLSFTTQPTLHETMGFVLHYMLMHDESSDTIEGYYPLPDPNASPQVIGGAITYGRRYTLCAVTGLAPGGDDDDAAAATAAAEAPQTKPANIPVAKRDWAKQIMDANNMDDLRAVNAEVEKAEELGHRFNPRFVKNFNMLLQWFDLAQPPENVTVGQVLYVVRDVLKAREESQSLEPQSQVQDWPTAEIPGDAPEPPEDD